MDATCAWCGAPKEEGPKCPKCKAIYAKAEALRAGVPLTAAALAPAPLPARDRDREDRDRDADDRDRDRDRDDRDDARDDDARGAPARVNPVRTIAARDQTPPWEGSLDDLRQELRLRLFAIPAALVIALLFYSSSAGHSLQRIFLTMMLHELGHAISAWLCGFGAVPTLWFTSIAETRGWGTPLLVTFALVALIVRSVRAGHVGLVLLAAALLLVQAAGTLGATPHTAQSLITFGGDGGAIVLGSALMATFFFGRETDIYKGWLRWGFLVIGAGAFVDTFALWWTARKDYDVIPFGEIEGVGLSDPTKLTDIYGWTVRALIGRYVALGTVCLLVLLSIWIYGVLQSRAELEAGRARGAK